ncbi:MAG: helix-turn-helix domain-containing protein [Lachnospiraceae bacterium]|jgi:two-component system response regulator YesN|nr:helix-turn-helix domain-containing protein [Lachnospiraceae bacterium]
MYRILLADDEGIAIDSLTFIIDKTWSGACELCSAKTGRAVIEAAENFRPDIAVMDIQMPGINGIEAIREIKRFCPDTVFLIMSAYDKFDYAKEALSLGVLDYLTKPLDREVFTEAMGRAMKAVDRLKEKRSSDLKTREKLETVVPVLETGFIYSLLLQDYDPANSDPYRELLDIHEDYGFIILVECGELVEKAGGASGAGTHMTNPIGTGIRIQNYYSRICGIVREFSSRAIIGQIMSNKIPVFVPHSSPQMDYNERTRLIASLQEMVTQLEDKTSVAFRVGIGAVHPVDDMKSSIAEAQNSLKAGTDTVSHADDLPVACEYDDDYPLKLEKSIFDSLQRGDADRAHDAAEQFFTWMEETQSQHVLSIRLKALEFVLWAEHLAYQEGALGVYHFNDREEYLDIVNTSSLPSLHRWFVSRITETTRGVATKTAKRSDNVVDTARAFIDSHYGNDISLDDVSREVDVSPYYFSKLFKEESGVTFIEYLTTLRMTKARQLLAEGRLSIKEICAAVGYQDPNYFSRIFKRATGVTPSDYKGQ